MSQKGANLTGSVKLQRSKSSNFQRYGNKWAKSAKTLFSCPHSISHPHNISNRAIVRLGAYPIHFRSDLAPISPHPSFWPNVAEPPPRCCWLIDVVERLKREGERRPAALSRTFGWSPWHGRTTKQWAGEVGEEHTEEARNIVVLWKGGQNAKNGRKSDGMPKVEDQRKDQSTKGRWNAEKEEEK